MAAIRLTIETETAARLFDALKAQNGDASDLGSILAGVLMTGDAGFADQIRLNAIYGISIVVISNLDKLKEEAARS